MTDLRITHIGGPTTLIEVGGWRMLTDPTFDPPGRTYLFGRGNTTRKLVGPAIAAADLLPIDAVLLTHDHHADNLDAAGRALLPTAGTVLTTRSGAARLGGNARGLGPWEEARLTAPDRPTIRVVATPARHGPPLSGGLVGEVVGFALQWTDQNVWISGDTVLSREVRRLASRLDVDVAILHLGGVRFPATGPIRYTMTARDAVQLCTLIRPRVAIPVHYEGWTHFQQPEEAVRREFSRAPAQVRDSLRWLTIGTPTSIDGRSDESRR